MKNSKRIITLNCGMGRDSLTLLCLCIEGALKVDGLGTIWPGDLDVVVFSNTGCEWTHTYALLPAVRALCRAHGIRFLMLDKGPVEYDPDNTASSWADIAAKAASGAYHARDAIIDDVGGRQTVVSISKGDCTENHKILPIRRFLNDLAAVRFGSSNRAWGADVRKGLREPHVTIIGIAADETERLRNGKPGPDYVTEAYPLVELGLAKADEAPILERHGLGHVRKSGCYMCPYQPLGWYWALRETQPDTFAEVVAYEARALAANPRINVTGIKREGQAARLDVLVTEWRTKNPAATVEAVLAKQYSRCLSEARAQRKAET